MIRKIVVPIDFSEGSLAALRKAAELARSTSAALLLLHADDFPIVLVGEIPYLPQHVVEEHVAYIERELASLVARVEKEGVTVSGRIVPGPPHSTILEVAAREGADLVVMGTQGRSGLRHLLIGSVAERIARTTNIPVMIVRSEPEAARAS